MTAKAFTNVLKLAPVYACAREGVDLLEAKQTTEHLVTLTDVSSAWEVIQLSMNTYSLFKVRTLNFTLRMRSMGKLE